MISVRGGGRVVRVLRAVPWAALVAAGCKSGSSQADAGATAPPPPPETPAATASAGAAAGSASSGSDAARSSEPQPVKLLDSGQPPRRKLRYAWRLDQKELLSMDMRTAATTWAESADGAADKHEEVPLPTVHVEIAVDPRSITAAGDLRYAWSVTAAKVVAEDGAPAQVTEGMSAEVDAIAHLAGTATVTDRGLTREIVAAGGGTPAGPMANQIPQTLHEVATPFPEEEVGVGARWRKISQLDDPDSLVAQAETFRLVGLEGDRGSVDDALAQTAPPHALHSPGPGGGKARMESMLASGEAKMRFDLSRLVPQATYDGTTKMVLSGGSGTDEEPNLRTVMHVFIAIAGSRR